MPDETDIYDWLDLTIQDFMSKTPEMLEQEALEVLLPIYRDMYRESLCEQLWKQYREWCRQQSPIAMKQQLLEGADIETEIERVLGIEMPLHEDHIKAEVAKHAAKIADTDTEDWANHTLKVFGMMGHWLREKEP